MAKGAILKKNEFEKDQAKEWNQQARREFLKGNLELKGDIERSGELWERMATAPNDLAAHDAYVTYKREQARRSGQPVPVIPLYEPSSADLFELKYEYERRPRIISAEEEKQLREFLKWAIPYLAKVRERLAVIAEKDSDKFVREEAQEALESFGR